jgi:hypothetical protein
MHQASLHGENLKDSAYFGWKTPEKSKKSQNFLF